MKSKLRLEGKRIDPKSILDNLAPLQMISRNNVVRGYHENSYIEREENNLRKTF